MAQTVVQNQSGFHYVRAIFQRGGAMHQGKVNQCFYVTFLLY